MTSVVNNITASPNEFRKPGHRYVLNALVSLKPLFLCILTVKENKGVVDPQFFKNISDENMFCVVYSRLLSRNVYFCRISHVTHVKY